MRKNCKFIIRDSSTFTNHESKQPPFFIFIPISNKDPFQSALLCWKQQELLMLQLVVDVSAMNSLCFDSSCFPFSLLFSPLLVTFCTDPWPFRHCLLFTSPIHPTLICYFHHVVAERKKWTWQVRYQQNTWLYVVVTVNISVVAPPPPSRSEVQTKQVWWILWVIVDQEKKATMDLRNLQTFRHPSTCHPPMEI